MKNNLIYWLILIIYIYIYWKVLGFIWNQWVPFNPLTDILAMFIVLVINIPLSLISTEITIKTIKNMD